MFLSFFEVDFHVNFGILNPRTEMDAQLKSIAGTSS